MAVGDCASILMLVVVPSETSAGGSACLAWQRAPRSRKNSSLRRCSEIRQRGRGGSSCRARGLVLRPERPL